MSLKNSVVCSTALVVGIDVTDSPSTSQDYLDIGTWNTYGIEAYLFRIP